MPLPDEPDGELRDAPAAASPSELLLPYRLRAVRIGVLAQTAVVLALVGVLLLDGGDDWNITGYLAAALAGAVGVLVVALLPWRRLLELGVADVFLYVWSVGDIVIIAVLIGFTGGASSPMWSVFILTSIFFAASYPPRGQLALYVATISAYLLALGFHGSLVLDRDLFTRLVVLSVSTYMTTFLSRELMQQMTAHDQVHRVARRRAAQIERVAGAARDIHRLDTAVVLRSFVEAAADLGYPAAGVAGITDGTIAILDSTGLPASVLGTEYPLEGSALEGSATTSGCVILVPDPERPLGEAGFGTLIASPIRVGGEIAAVLGVAARRPPSDDDQLTLEPLELLAEVAGRALEHVGVYERQRDALDRLERLDVLKSDFISNASHELRTPTTVVYGLIHTLVRRSGELDDGTRGQLLQRLMAASETLKDTVTTLVDFARIESGQLSPRMEPAALAGIVTRVVDDLTEVLAGHEVSLDISSSLAVQADRVLLHRAIENVLVNAANYTPPGTAIRVRGRQEGDVIRLTVADDGPGIPLDELDQLTDRFFRGGDPNTRTTRGLGLGLAFVRDVLAAHGGELDITSVPGAGSSFTLVLPRGGGVDAGTAQPAIVDLGADAPPPASLGDPG